METVGTIFWVMARMRLMLLGAVIGIAMWLGAAGQAPKALFLSMIGTAAVVIALHSLW